jgi:hypothetical protein
VSALCPLFNYLLLALFTSTVIDPADDETRHMMVNTSYRGMHQVRTKPFLTLFGSLATTLVADLRIDKRIRDGWEKEVNCFKGHTLPKIPISLHRTNEERRAVLTCFIISSRSVSSPRENAWDWWTFVSLAKYFPAALRGTTCRREHHLLVALEPDSNHS